jgi:hypothetical protein
MMLNLEHMTRLFLKGVKRLRVETHTAIRVVPVRQSNQNEKNEIAAPCPTEVFRPLPSNIKNDVKVYSNKYVQILGRIQDSRILEARILPSFHC